MPESPHYNNEYNKESGSPTNLPKPTFVLGRRGDACEVHAVVRSKEREGQEHDGDASEDEDSFVLGVGDDGEFVLLNGAQLKQLEGGSVRLRRREEGNGSIQRPLIACSLSTASRNSHAAL